MKSTSARATEQSRKPGGLPSTGSRASLIYPPPSSELDTPTQGSHDVCAPEAILRTLTNVCVPGHQVDRRWRL
eukprot:scaffold295_cov257-Pinguiococcus_pyrenoidosus.AAC.13